MLRVQATVVGLWFAFGVSAIRAQSSTCPNPNVLQTFTNNAAAGTATGVVQSFVVPSNQVTIDALGAQGGNNSNTGGLGAEVVTTLSVTPGQTLCVVVGGQGGHVTTAGFGAGGGGGSFVYAISSGTCASNLAQVTTGPSPNLLIAAGGGGGGGNDTSGKSGLAPTGAGAAGASTGATGDQGGGSGGNGGNGGSAITNSGGGGGLLTDGASANTVPGGQALINGAGGGAKNAFSSGGFGGGGAATDTGGGGGGYNGGGAGGISISIGGGGGGGSFSRTAPLSPFTQSGVRSGNGIVTMCYAPVVTATHFTVSAPGTATAGVPLNFTVSALDASNNTVTGYNGTVHFTSTDGAASLPLDAALTNGTGTFPATLRTPGNQTITASDMANSLTGTSGGIMVSIITGTIHLLGSSVCAAGSNWSNPVCWDLNRAPVTGDDVVIAGSAQAATNDDLGAGVMLHSLTISGASGAVAIAGGPIGLQGGATVTDSFSNSGTDTLPGISLNGPAMLAVSAAGETLQVSGAITGAFPLTKTGPGGLLLSGTNTYSGTTTLAGGTLSVTGSLAASAVTVGSGSTLLGTGTVLSIAVQSGGVLSGNLTATGGATFAAGSIFRVAIASATTYTQLLGGPANLNDGPTLNVALTGGFAPNVGTKFSIIPGAVSGTFQGLPNGAVISAGTELFEISYASATLTALGTSPSPSVPTLSWPGMILMTLLLAAVGLRMLGGRNGTQSPELDGRA